MVPRSSPFTSTGATTSAHEASGSKPCSDPIATERPLSSTSSINCTTTSCCSRIESTDRTVSTASNADAMLEDPPTKTWSRSWVASSPMAPRVTSTTSSTARSPEGGRSSRGASAEPMR